MSVILYLTPRWLRSTIVGAGVSRPKSFIPVFGP